MTTNTDTAASPAGSPVATVAEVHMSRYTVEWIDGPLPIGTALYAKPEPDAQLAKFYQVDSVPALIAAMEDHILRLQGDLRAVRPSFSFAPSFVRGG